MNSSKPHLYEDLNQDQWLLGHAHDVTSLSGEDGIIEKIFETIGPGNKWCVEFGAWDGKKYSNTFNLIQNCGWSGVLIEAERRRFGELTDTYKGNPRAVCLNRFVTFEGGNSLDSLLATTTIPHNFDLLSIDIDGADYHVWESVAHYEPKVVIVEFNPTIPDQLEFVQPRNMSVRQGNSILSLAKLGKQKGYELICITEYNAIFVHAELFPAFHIADNRISRLRPDRSLQFSLFQLYDGTFVVRGPAEMPWQGVPITQDSLQVLPKLLRAYPVESLGRGRRLLHKVWELFSFRLARRLAGGKS